jgi:hypothetical protein
MLVRSYLYGRSEAFGAFLYRYHTTQVHALANVSHHGYG